MKEPKLKFIEEGLNLILEVLVDGYGPLYFKVNGEVELINTNHMKELNIEAPEGYEIDNENSDLSRGIVRFKQTNKKLDYNEICILLGLDLSQVYIDTDDVIDGSFPLQCIDEFEGNESASREQLKALLALNKLKNVADYLNNGWKPNWSEESVKYVLKLRENRINTDSSYYNNTGVVVFKNTDVAKKAVEVLGEDVIKLALSFGSI